MCFYNRISNKNRKLMINSMFRMRFCGLKRACRWSGLGLLVWMLSGVGPAWSQAPDKVSIFVAAEKGDHERAVAWVEGIWMSQLRNRLKDSQQYLGGSSTEELEAIKKAKKNFVEGKKAYEDLSPDKALIKFTKSIQLFESASSNLWDLKPVARSWMYVGISHLLSGKRKKAEQAFNQAVVLDPTIDIRGATKEADKVKVFDEVKKQTGLTAQGVLEIRAKPHAAVFVNGRLVGATPVRLRLRKGKNFVMLRREGYQTWGTVANVTGQTGRFSHNMKPLSARGNWYQTGVLAVQHVGQAKSMNPSVSAFGAISQSRYLLLAKVKFVKGGKQISIRAAAYDVVNKKQLAWGGAVAAWGSGASVAAKLASNLMTGNSSKLGGWPLSDERKPTPPKQGGSKAGLAVGLTIALLALAGGGVVLGLYLTGNLTGPKCTAEGSCIEVKLE